MNETEFSFQIFVPANMKIQTIWILGLNLKLNYLTGINCCCCWYLKVAGDRFRSPVCIYENSIHEVRRLIPKMREVFTNRFRNVSASIIERAKRCLVNYTILQRIVLLHEVLTIARELKLAKLP